MESSRLGSQLDLIPLKCQSCPSSTLKEQESTLEMWACSWQNVVLDIKPYVPEFDVTEAETVGWLRDQEPDMTKDDGGFHD